LFTQVIPFLLAVGASTTFAQSQAVAPKEATETTRAVNRAVQAQLPMSDKQAFEDARRGLIEALGDRIILSATGRPVWSLQGYEFLGAEEPPDTVNPALWRHARVNMANGLFKVVDRVYQVRGLDLSNMTIIEGDHGLIVIDPLVTRRDREGVHGSVFQAPTEDAGGGTDLFAQPTATISVALAVSSATRTWLPAT
jgi:alkyl sulfatase BDS1-like metallo-beta-lactamase superfamily hydrolase